MSQLEAVIAFYHTHAAAENTGCDQTLRKTV
jgi:hypothetical protein